MGSASPDRPPGARPPHECDPALPPGAARPLGVLERLLRRLGRARYRVTQVFVGIRPAIAPAEIAEVQRLLTPAQLALFTGMEGRDRRHSMNMVWWLRARYPAPGPSDLLLRACLLHDVGKGTLNLADRVLFVLLGQVPGLQRRIAAADGATFRRRQWTIRHHARLGADRVAATGAEPALVELVARHLDPRGDDPLGRWLRAADEAC